MRSGGKFENESFQSTCSEGTPFFGGMSSGYIEIQSTDRHGGVGVIEIELFNSQHCFVSEVAQQWFRGHFSLITEFRGELRF